jgi:hypothetical protein
LHEKITRSQQFVSGIGFLPQNQRFARGIIVALRQVVDLLEN